MGYYINITDADFAIPADKLNDAYEAVCRLNNMNHLKRGGHHPRPDGEYDAYKPNQYVWFSWMDWNFHETCSDLQAVLRQVGFGTYMDENDNLVISTYSDKAGQEDVFLWALARYAVATLTDGAPFVDWVGEEGEHWRNLVHEGRFYSQRMVMAPHGEPRLFDPSSTII